MCTCRHVSAPVKWQTVGNKMPSPQQFSDYLNCYSTIKKGCCWDSTDKNQHCSWYCNHNVYSPGLFAEHFLPNREDIYIMILLELYSFQSLLLSGSCYEDRSRNKFFICIWLSLISWISTCMNSKHFNRRISFKLCSTHWYHQAWRHLNSNSIQTSTRMIH